MPELPEVEAVANEARHQLLRSTIAGVRVFRWDVVTGAARRSERLELGSRVDRVLRHGKQLALVGRCGSVLVVQLGMSGEFGVVRSGSAIAAHTHLVWTLDRGRDLRFVDPRRFGGITWLKDDAALRARWARLGPDALDLTPGWWARLASSRRSLKAALLDQRAVAGIGNIYADEALAQVGLAPQRRCCDVPSGDFRALGEAVGSIMRSAISGGGSTIRTYQRLGSGPGTFQKQLRVYGRAGLACLACAKPLKTALVAGRTTVWCGSCQT